jgi:hypothetical protein
MLPLRKILVILVIVLSILILWYQLHQRSQIMKLPANALEATQAGQGATSAVKEGLTNSAPPAQKNELQLMTVKSPGAGVSTYNVQSMGNLPLQEFCIKSSYNSAYSGSYIGLDTIKYVLSRGCRFLDFELYFINNGACVGYSDDGYNMLSKNTLTLSDTLGSVMANAFSAPSPNLGDPLFVQLRIRSNDTNMYSEVSSAITSTIGPRLYKGKVDGNTNINDLMGKVILIVDRKVSGDYANYPTCNAGDAGCVNLGTLTNMESNTAPLFKYSNAQILNMLSNPPTMIDKKKSDVVVLRMIEPTSSSETTNPNMTFLIKNYGTQIVENRFYVKDTTLAKYEQFFSDNKTALVPFYTGLPYLKK